MAPPRRLEVQNAFHEQAHASKMTALGFSPGGAALWTGCDAAAPKPVLDSSPDLPVALLNSVDGKTLGRAEGLPPCNMRLLLPLPAEVGTGMLCADGSGALWALSEDGGTVLSSAALPGTPAASVAATAAAEQQHSATAQEAAEQEEAADDSPTAGAEGTGPEFEPDHGYRGHKEGYLFRDGSLGRGYYRKDVVRRYCASVGLEPPATPPPEAKGSAGRGVGKGQLGGEAARQYIQRLLAAPPSMHSVVADAAAGLLFTSSLGPSDCAVRVWRLWDACSGAGSKAAGSSGESGGLLQPALVHTLCGHTAPVLSLALSPDRRLLYTGSHDYTVRVWSTSDWHCLRVLKGHGGGVRVLAVAPDGATLYSAASDNTIRAWSTQHWVCLRTLHGRHEDYTWPACLALSPDGTLLASGSTGPFGASTIKVFQTSSGGGRDAGDCLVTFAQLGYHDKGGISSLLFSPDGATLYSSASDGTLAAWRLRWSEPAADGAKGSTAGGLRRGFL